MLPGGATSDASKWAAPLPSARSAVAAASAADWALPRRGTLRAEQMHPVTPAAPARPLPEIVARVLDAFAQARDDRMHSETLADALGIHTAEGKGDAVALADLLRPLGITPMPTPFNRGGKPRRGYALADIQKAAERIGRGEPSPAAEAP
ncbi:hypothetical protein [Streptosporangium sp. NPDC002607]